MTDDQELRHIIQDGLRKARDSSLKWYEPSPGQTLSHVDHRVMMAVMQILEDNGLEIVRSELLEDVRAFRNREWLSQ